MEESDSSSGLSSESDESELVDSLEEDELALGLSSHCCAAATEISCADIAADWFLRYKGADRDDAEKGLDLASCCDCNLNM